MNIVWLVVDVTSTYHNNVAINGDKKKFSVWFGCKKKRKYYFNLVVISVNTANTGFGSCV